MWSLMPIIFPSRMATRVTGAADLAVEVEGADASRRACCCCCCWSPDLEAVKPVAASEEVAMVLGLMAPMKEAQRLRKPDREILAAEPTR